MNKIFHKIRSWWIGEFDSDPEMSGSVEEIFSDESNYMKRPFARRVLSAIWQFWLRRWTILLPLIVMATVLLFIHFDSKATRKPEKEKESSKNNTYLNHKNSNDLIEKQNLT